MRIVGIVTAVGKDYADLLMRFLPLWSNGLDRLAIVTDNDTALYFTNNSRIETVALHDFRSNGATFDKSGGIMQGMKYIEATSVSRKLEDWILCFDADVEPAENWRKLLEHYEPELGYLYGANRIDENGAWIKAGDPVAGFFMLWHAQDPVWTADPTLGSWRTASSYDSNHWQRWPRSKVKTLPLVLTHYGPTGERWLGPGTGKAEVDALQEERRRLGPGSWRKERLDR